MRLSFLPVLALVLSGCGVLSAGSSPTVTPAPSATSEPPTSIPTPNRPRPTATPVIGRDYASFITSLCHALTHRDAGAVIAALPHYQYNSGLRYGYLGDGEGQTADPGNARNWLASSHVACEYFTPDASGHGVVLTRGWSMPQGPWSLVEVDIFAGHWKINDFTFGTRQTLYHALLTTSGPVLRFAG